MQALFRRKFRQNTMQSINGCLLLQRSSPLNEDVFKCLDDRHSVLKSRHIGGLIIEKMKRFIEVFVEMFVMRMVGSFSFYS
jgi:type I restriction enzyme R subunit